MNFQNNETKDKKKENIIVGFILEFCNKNKLWLFITIIILFITSPLELIVLSNLFTNFTTSINKMEYNKSLNILWQIAGLYVFIDIVYIIGSYFDKIYYPKMEKFIRFKLVDIIFKNIEVNYDNENISNIILKILLIPNIAIYSTQSFIYWIVTFCITVLAIIIYISYINLKIGGMLIFLLLIFVSGYYYVLLRIIHKSREREKEEKVLMTRVDDVLSNSLTILASKKTNDEKEYLNSVHSIYDLKHKDQLWYSSKGIYLFSFIITAILIIIVYTILTLYKSKKITNKDAIELVIIIIFFIRYLKTSAARTVHNFIGYGKLLENEKMIKSMLNDTIQDGDKVDIPITGDIEFKNVTFEYNRPQGEVNNSDNKEKIKSLDKVSFKIKSLDRVAIIGTNGSGKSTIVKLMMGFYNVSSGQVLHNGVNVLEINREYLRSKIAIINQKIVLFNRSIIDNICYGNNISKEKVKQTIKNLHIMRIFKNQPQGLETLAGLHGSNLSGGQKQIIHLLRCYLSNKSIIIMDEPTSAIDSVNKKYIFRMIDEMSKKSTLIVITHDHEYASSFSTKIYIEDGKIVKIKGSNDSSMPYDDYDDNYNDNYLI
jgi:ABC-type bacteriocin/lantibiotic exporter with double-glycine peptidase domain